MALTRCLFVGPIGATTCRRYWLKPVAAIDLENPQPLDDDRNVWLGFNVGHQVRIRPIAATYWLSPLIVSPLLILFLVVFGNR
ncbi:hypothetical protein Hanom_Chr04g00309011 [Helianthus anomalus]